LESTALGVSNLALIGFRASGKTSVGQTLAARLGWTFVDMDERLVAGFGTDIHTWVRQHGWDAFREAEAHLLGELATIQKQVVATGGGVILRPDNRERLRRAFWVVWLQASAATIETRLAQDPITASQRPPLTDLSWQDEIGQLLIERTPLYAATAHMAIDTEGLGIADLVAAILLRSRLTKGKPSSPPEV
jgi:shikimate kinase